MAPKRPLDTLDASAMPAAKRMAAIQAPLASIFQAGRLAPISWRVQDDQRLYHLVYGSPGLSQKAAIFDMDDCLTKRLPATKANAMPWKWLYKQIPERLRQASRDGYFVAIVSNQGIDKRQIPKLREKLVSVLRELAVPCHLFAAMGDNWMRKPMPGIFELIESEAGGQLDRATSIFVGDAAGRPSDHSDSDRKFAFNSGLPFQTPEEYFLGRSAQPFALTGFDATAAMARKIPSFVPQNTPLVAASGTGRPDVAIAIGERASGMTRCYADHFAAAGYLHLVSKTDDASTRAELERALVATLQAGHSVFLEDVSCARVDHRSRLLALAKQCGARVRALRFSASRQHAWHNNLYRSLAAPAIDGQVRLAQLGPDAYAVTIQDPHVDEDFDELKTVNFVFRGTEVERARYAMWLELNRSAVKDLEGRTRSRYGR